MVFEQVHDGATLEVNLDALVCNHQLLRNQFSGKHCAAVVKANGYGLGAVTVAKALMESGCKYFFVASLDEGIELRDVLGAHPTIYVFHGVQADEMEDCYHARLMPVLNTFAQLEHWAGFAAKREAAHSILHIDTGMCRLGLDAKEVDALKHKPELLHQANVSTIMSHLACANDPSHSLNQEQLAYFNEIKRLFPGFTYSLANSSGVFLPNEFHFDLARPGCSLYGITPRGKYDNPMEAVATLTAPILQIREIDRDQTIGYGATHVLKRGSRTATIALGYADGVHRMLSNQGYAFIDGAKVPCVGRVSMDMITLDVSAIEKPLHAGMRVELIGKHQTVDELADNAGTIGYEIFTGLGRRIKRIYTGKH
jgi:alanine racemase